jgi:hypothetical protein
MALSENSPSPAFDPARLAKNFHDSDLPHDALDRLSLLHREAGHSVRLSRFLARTQLSASCSC